MGEVTSGWDIFFLSPPFKKPLLSLPYNPPHTFYSPTGKFQWLKTSTDTKDILQHPPPTPPHPTPPHPPSLPSLNTISP